MTRARVATTNRCGTLNLSPVSVGDFSMAAAVVTQTGSTRPKRAGTDAVIRRTARRRPLLVRRQRSHTTSRRVKLSNVVTYLSNNTAELLSSVCRLLATSLSAILI